MAKRRRQRQYRTLLWPEKRYPESQVMRDGEHYFAVTMEQGTDKRRLISVIPVRPRKDHPKPLTSRQG